MKPVKLRIIRSLAFAIAAMCMVTACSDGVDLVTPEKSLHPKDRNYTEASAPSEYTVIADDCVGDVRYDISIVEDAFEDKSLAIINLGNMRGAEVHALKSGSGFEIPDQTLYHLGSKYSISGFGYSEDRILNIQYELIVRDGPTAERLSCQMTALPR